MLEKAKEINPSAKQKLEASQRKIYSEETYYEEMINNFTTKERSQMKLCRLDNYCLFIASRFLESVEEHINLVKVSKRMRSNMEKFHYNPITLDEITIKFFPNVQTLHIYGPKDKYIEYGRIYQYVYWNKNEINYF